MYIHIYARLVCLMRNFLKFRNERSLKTSLLVFEHWLDLTNTMCVGEMWHEDGFGLHQILLIQSFTYDFEYVSSQTNSLM